MSVVPDSITPVEGWKTWFFRKDNSEAPLASPNGCLDWKIGEPADAGCASSPQYQYQWEITSEREEAHDPEADDSGVFTMLYASGTYAPKAVLPPSRPRTELPPGLYWKLTFQQVLHSAPEHLCTCGIYIADDISIAADYGYILGKVKGWGTVVQHGAGYRVQHAYPSELYAQNMDEALVLADYGVPVHLAEDVTDEDVLEVLRKKTLIAQGGIAPKSVSRTLTAGAVVAWAGVSAEVAIFATNPSIVTGAALATMTMGAGLLTGMRILR